MKKHQSSLLNFFPSSSSASAPATKKDSSSPPLPSSTSNESKKNSGQEQQAEEQNKDDEKEEPKYEPMIPQKTSAPSSVSWQSLHNHHVIIRKPRLNGDPIRSKVAAFDLDGTIMKWVSEAPGFWPSRLEHFELWNAGLIKKLRQLYDDGYQLVIFTNQGGVQKAHNGKRATLVKTIIDWLESIIERPLCAVASTKSIKKSPNDSFHKPQPHMWTKVLATNTFAQGKGFDKVVPTYDLSSSFFVGDSADEDDSQGGVDRKFAQNVGITFYTPDEYFGQSHQELRQKAKALDSVGAVPTPSQALQLRQALLGGYLQGPIVLILCGVQGSGKSTFCQQLVEGSSDDDDDNNNKTPCWVWLSQDTINKGKPGTREKVEEETRKAIQQGNSVVVDRMHLDKDQRKYFVDVAKECNVPVHVVLLNPSKEIITTRVKYRTNHPGKVEGDSGVKLAIGSISRLVMPSYDEGLDLISCVSTEYASVQLARQYKGIVKADDGLTKLIDRVPLPTDPSQLIPVISLGMMKVGKRQCKETVTSMIDAGFRAIDTAPTYNNEDKVGEALQEVLSKGEEIDSNPVYIVAKVPKRAATAEEVRSELETTLQKLKCDSADILLLHWPSDVMVGNTLNEVWQCMEEFVKDGKCKALGVCNFNEAALTALLKNCTIPPAVNQVERHPLNSQMSLLDFCSRNNIQIQAHTPLGQGKDQLLGNEVVKKISEETSLTPAQVVLMWNLQQGILVVPKCTQASHGKEILELVSPTD